jgi:hypothetical protein
VSHRGSDKDRGPSPLETTSIIAIIIGTATTLLITAVQNSMAMGSMLVAALREAFVAQEAQRCDLLTSGGLVLVLRGGQTL